jgi:glutamate decarboxylase
MRALVKLRLGRTLADDLAQACETLNEERGLHEDGRRRVKIGTGTGRPGRC